LEKFCFSPVLYDSGSDCTNVTLAWIKLNDLDGIQRIVSSVRTSGLNGFGFGTLRDGLRFTTFDVKDYDSTTISLEPGKWYHVAAVMSRNNDVTFYVDGDRKETIDHNRPGHVNVGAFYVGATTEINSPKISELFRGAIDEVAILDWALAAEDIKAIYESGWDALLKE